MHTRGCFSRAGRLSFTGTRTEQDWGAREVQFSLPWSQGCLPQAQRGRPGTALAGLRVLVPLLFGPLGKLLAA